MTADSLKGGGGGRGGVFHLVSHLQGRSGCRGIAPRSWEGFKSTSGFFHLRTEHLTNVSPTQSDHAVTKINLVSPTKNDDTLQVQYQIYISIFCKFFCLLDEVCAMLSVPPICVQQPFSQLPHLRTNPGSSSRGYQARHGHTPSIHMCSDTWPKGNCQRRQPACLNKCYCGLAC